MIFFSIPADFKNTTIDRLNQLNETYPNAKVIETYGQLSEGTFLNSGRTTDVIPYADFKVLEQYVEYGNKNNIKFHYTLNPSCMGNMEFEEEGIDKIQTLLNQLYEIGIYSFTIAIPPLMEIARSLNEKLEIKTSTICEITSPGKGMFYKNLGAKRIVADADITRDFKTLKNICKAFGDGVEIIVNNVCYKNCAYKIFHYNHDSHCNQKGNIKGLIKDYYTNRCSLQKSQEPENLIKINWIRPEDLKYYKEIGIRHFKIQGRQSVLKGNLIRTVESYMKEDFDGNLFDLITLFAPYNAFQPYIDNKKLDQFVERFYRYPNFCTDLCESCGYCASFAEKAMLPEEVGRLNEQAQKFYREYDKFSKIIIPDKHESLGQSVKRYDISEKFTQDFEF